MGVKDKKFNIMGVHWRIQFLGGVHKYMGNCLKRGAWTVCRFKRGLGKKKGVVFVCEGVDTPMHTIACLSQSTFYVSAIMHLLDPLCCKDFSNTFYIYCMTLAKCNCFAFSLNKNISSQLVE